MLKVELQAQPRTLVGRVRKKLRTQAMIPAVIYGHNFKSLNIQIPVKEFKSVYAQAGESTLVYLKLDTESYPTIIHDVVVDPVHDFVVHADFYKVKLDEKIHAKIPVVITGESAAVKDGGILVKNINEIEVEGLPQDLPHEFTVDISSLLKIKDQIQIKDLKVPANIEIKANIEEIVVLIQEPISEEKLKADLEATAPTADDVEVIEKEKKEAEVAEGETAPVETAKEPANPPAGGKK